MATKQGGSAASQVPISRHPAFPAVVALWFAALLGIGSLVLPVQLFETAVDATGFSAAVPSAEPPLGVTARILIALVAASLGVLTGLFIARRVAAAQGRTTRAPHASAPLDTAKRPISAHEELWSEGFDEPVEPAPAAPIPGRRRALSVTDESGPSAFLQDSLLPDESSDIVVVNDGAFTVEPVADEALELAEFVADQPEDAPPATYDPHADGEPETPMEAPRPFDVPAAEPGFFDAPEDATEPHAGDAVVNQDPEPEGAVPPAADPRPFAAPTPDPAPADDRPLGDLSISELVDRFAVSLQRAAERAEAERPVEISTNDAGEISLQRYVPDLGVEAVEAPRFSAPVETYFEIEADAGREPEAETDDEMPVDVPFALRPVAFDEIREEEEPEDLALTLELPQETRPFDRPDVPETIAASGAGDEAEDAIDDSYSSLLNMRKEAAGREFVRIENDAEADEADGEPAVEPMVVFPGQERPGPVAVPNEPAPANPERPFAAPAGASDPVQTERALRDALRKLQRLSGAA